MKQTIQLPKIGIRPVIDGRRMGVRESLEEQTMKMARATAEFLQEVVRHPCGTPVECVIADTCIAGMAESAACDDKFSAQNIGLTITVTPCWCYGSETIDMDPFRPKAIWGFNGTERLARSIWQQHWRRTIKKDCQPSPFTAMTCRMLMTRVSLLMCRKNCCASLAQV